MKQCPMCDTSYPDERTTCETDGAVLIEVREWAPGTMVRGKYRILAKVGQGGMGIVYKATHLVFEEVLALKVMAAHLAGDSKFVRRFRQEAQVTHRLQHPNIVRVQDFDQAEDGSPFIVMDYVEGVSLRQLLQASRGPLQLARALWIARGMAEALGAAHILGMVHRDIKPENVLLARDAQGRDVPKVLDFGIVAMKEGSTSLGTGLLLTPSYGSPEQWKGMRAAELDGRADLYALGVTLYEMLAGRLPFHAHTEEGWMRAHLDEMPPPPSHFNRELEQTPGVDAFVARLLEKDRERRPKDAQEFLSELNLVEAQLSWGQITVPAKQANRNAQDMVATRLSSGGEEQDADRSEGIAAARASDAVPTAAPARASRLPKVSAKRRLAILTLVLAVVGPIGLWLSSHIASDRDTADPHDAAAQLALAHKYETGENLPKDYNKAAEWYRKAADQGSAAAQYNLGRMYRDGQGVPQDYAQAEQWLRRAANQDNADAENELGWMYQHGLGVSQDDLKADSWYERAAKHDNAVAEYNLGWLREHGRGSPTAGGLWVDHYSRAAKLGNAAAQYTLGSMYELGRSVPRNYTEAVRWYQKAANRGYAAGQNSLGMMYLDGLGVPQNDGQAVQWFRKAAEQRDVSGAHNLGEVYAQGRGVSKDIVEACKWFLLAKAGGDTGARARLAEMEREMTSAQIDEATRRAEDWKARHPPSGD